MRTTYNIYAVTTVRDWIRHLTWDIRISKLLTDCRVIWEIKDIGESQGLFILMT